MSIPTRTDSMPETPPSPAPPPDPALLELFADPGAIRRGRLLATFLVVTWLSMGFMVVTNGVRTLVGGLAFAFGLLTLVGALSQIRGARLARSVPLIRLAAGHLEYRHYTGATLHRVDISGLQGVRSADRDGLVLELADGQAASVPWLALSPADRGRLHAALSERPGPTRND